MGNSIGTLRLVDAKMGRPMARSNYDLIRAVAQLKLARGTILGFKLVRFWTTNKLNPTWKEKKIDFSCQEYIFKLKII